MLESADPGCAGVVATIGRVAAADGRVNFETKQLIPNQLMRKFSYETPSRLLITILLIECFLNIYSKVFSQDNKSISKPLNYLFFIREKSEIDTSINITHLSHDAFYTISDLSSRVLFLYYELRETDHPIRRRTDST